MPKNHIFGGEKVSLAPYMCSDSLNSHALSISDKTLFQDRRLKKVTKILYSSDKRWKKKIFLKSWFFELFGAFHSTLMVIAKTHS